MPSIACVQHSAWKIPTKRTAKAAKVDIRLVHSATLCPNV